LSHADFRCDYLQSILAHILPPYVDTGIVSSCAAASIRSATYRVLSNVSCKNSEDNRKTRSSPLTAAVNSFGLIGPDDNVRQGSAVFENEHGLGLARLILLGAYTCCNASTSFCLLGRNKLLTTAVIQLHAAIEGTRDDDGRVGGHSARRLWKNSRHTRRSSASASSGGGSGNDGSRCCCGLLRRCRCSAAAAGVVARTFCRQKFGLVVAVRGPSRQGRRCSDDTLGEGRTEG
jgi:hypothetical protein